MMQNLRCLLNDDIATIEDNPENKKVSFHKEKIIVTRVKVDIRDREKTCEKPSSNKDFIYLNG